VAVTVLSQWNVGHCVFLVHKRREKREERREKREERREKREERREKREERREEGRREERRREERIKQTSSSESQFCQSNELEGGLYYRSLHKQNDAV
jgi:hypothetical protein